MWYPAKGVAPAQSSTSTVVVVVASISSVLLLVAGGIIALLYIRNKKYRNVLSHEEVQEFLNGREMLDKNHPPVCASEYLKFDKDFELFFSHITIG